MSRVGLSEGIDFGKPANSGYWTPKRFMPEDFPLENFAEPAAKTMG